MVSGPASQREGSGFISRTFVCGVCTFFPAIVITIQIKGSNSDRKSSELLPLHLVSFISALLLFYLFFYLN